jgi:hypothetical protein
MTSTYSVFLFYFSGAGYSIDVLSNFVFKNCQLSPYSYIYACAHSIITMKALDSIKEMATAPKHVAAK